MAAASPRNPRRTKGRHRKPSTFDSSNCAQWLRVGTVGIGLGAAIASGQGIASAAPDDSSNAGPAKDAADTGPSSPSSAGDQAATTGSTPKKTGTKRPPTTKVSGQGDDTTDKDSSGGSKADADADANGSSATDKPAAANANKRAQPQIKTKPRKSSGADSASAPTSCTGS